jgi:predicted Zn-dependent peptidase
MAKSSRAFSSRIRRTHFENGLTLLTESTPQFEGLSAGAWVNVGSRHELKGEHGATHFLEHMLFKGTKKRSAQQIAQEVDRIGGEFNAFTAREETCFHLLLLDRHVGLACDMLEDVLLHSKLSRVEVDRERKVILQEIAMVDDSPEDVAHDLFLENVFSGKGLGRSILGTDSSIRRMKQTTIQNYFRHFYRPENLVLSFAGDVSHEKVRRLLSRMGKHAWPGRDKAPSATRLQGLAKQEKTEFQEGSGWVVREGEQVHWVWGCPAPDQTSPDRYAFYLMNLHLGGGMSSTLFQEIREKHGLAYSVYSNYSPFSDAGVFTVYAATAPGHVALSLKLLKECLNRVVRKPLPRAELESLKENLKGTLLLSNDSVESRMSAIARNEILFGGEVPLATTLQRIDAVTSEEIQKLALQTIGNLEKQALWIVGPRPKPAVRKKLGVPLVR